MATSCCCRRHADRLPVGLRPRLQGVPEDLPGPAARHPKPARAEGHPYQPAGARHGLPSISNTPPASSSRL
ncbi:hypothetical protein FOCC_FOCC000130 [Frankliniella occidentalis]|nr:hypothetical protein FOCC_FOCC000130 [Frankliniella occidentalis]